MLQGGTNNGANADERNAWLNQNCVLSTSNSSTAHLYQKHSQGWHLGAFVMEISLLLRFFNCMLKPQSV